MLRPRRRADSAKRGHPTTPNLAPLVPGSKTLIRFVRACRELFSAPLEANGFWEIVLQGVRERAPGGGADRESRTRCRCRH